MTSDPHIPDHDLLQAIDGELSSARSGEVSAHLSHCWSCRARSGELEQAISEFIQLRRPADSPLPDPAGPAARLRAHLAELTVRDRPVRIAWTPAPMVGALTLVLAIGAVVWISGRSAAGRALPDSRMTPGATRSISKEQVCIVPAPDENRAVPAELASRVFHQYGIRRPRPRAYEVDYLITPALGGADDIRNLWPQPYAAGVWTARVKDALEDYLRTQVCDGRLDLALAQHEIASDWISAYRKYFRTAKPLPAHALFLKDRPWE